MTGYVFSAGFILVASMNWSLKASHRANRTSWSDVIIVWLTGRVSSGGDIMQETFLIWKLLCFTYILALVRPVPEKIPIGKLYFIFEMRGKEWEGYRG